MSTYLTLPDYERAIKSEELQLIIEADTATLNTAEEDAISFMKSYLSARYDTATIFALTDTERHPIITKYCIDIVLYYLFGRIQPDQVPELRKDNYDIAERWLSRTAKGEVNLPDLPVPAEDPNPKAYVKWGSQTKRDYEL